MGHFMTPVTCRCFALADNMLSIMALAALIVSRDGEAVSILAQILRERGLEAEPCDDREVAAAHLAEQRFALVIVDCEDETEALNMVAITRAASVNSSTLLVAMVDPQNEVGGLFERGVNFVMYKPISVERASQSLQAAWSLLPRERRRKERTHISGQASITFATTEDAAVPLLNLSEDGIAIHSQEKMPPPCRVYFHLTLPGEPSPVRLAAEVIWQDWRGRVGLHFAHVPQASRRTLQDWFRRNPIQHTKKNSPAPVKLERFVLTSPEPRLPQAAGTVPSEDDRRAQARRTCRLGVNVYRPEGSVLQHCTLTDVSASGCYIETTVPLSVGTRAIIEVRTQELKLRVEGKVRSMHPGFGMGVEFRARTAEDKEQLGRLLAFLDVKAEASAKS